MTARTVSAPGAVSLALPTLLAVAGFAACGGDGNARGPVELRFATDAGPTVYRTSYRQAIEWGPVTVTRSYGARYTVGGTTEGEAMAARLDSLRIHHATPHGQQALDTRQVVGSGFNLVIPERGGPPTYGDEPVFEMPGMLEGRVPLSRLIDYGFPHLPDGAVMVGDTWTSRSTRSHVEAQITMPAEVSTEYRLAGWETIGGAEYARIEGHVTGSLSGRVEPERGPPVDYAGTLDGRLTWLLDPVTGTLLQLSGEEVSEGILTSGGAETPIEQTTTIEISGTKEGV